MTIPDSLKDIINDNAHIQLDNSSHELTIKETAKDAMLKQVVLSGVATNTTFAWKLDWKSKLSPYFEDGKDLDKGCDAIVVTKIKSQWYIFIVELKSKAKRKVTRIRKQFKSSLCFVEYIKAILRTIYKDNTLNNAKTRCALFSNDASNLPKTRDEYRSTSKKIDGISIKHLNGRLESCHIKKLK